MPAVDTSLLALAEQQHGLVTRGQVIELTSSKRAADAVFRSPNWSPITDQVARRHGAPATRESHLLAAVLDAGADAVLAHGPAAGWWGLGGCSLDPIVLVTTKSSRRRTVLAEVRRIRELPPHWTTTLRGVPIVKPELLALQLFATCREERAERLVERLWSMRVLSGASIARLLSEMGERGRNGTAGLRRYLEPRGPGYVPSATNLETRVQQVLRDAGIEMRPQVNSGAETWTGRVDFRHPTLPLLLEVQSEAFHTALVDAASDATRKRALDDDGLTVVEVWDTDVWSRPWNVVTAVDAAIRVATGTLQGSCRNTERVRGE